VAGETERASRSRRQLILVGVGAAVLAALIFLLWLFALRTPMVPAFTNLKATDASLIVDELTRQKVPYKLADDGSTILVPQDQVDSARIGILGGDLPLKGTVGFELFSKSDMGLTEFAQKINYQRALQGELARTLMSISTVESARVHITLPETGVFQEEHRPAKASVTITPKLGALVDGRAVMGIQRLVASAVEDLDASNVVVLDAGGKQLSAEPLAGMLDPAATSSADSAEQSYAARIRPVLMQLVADPAMRVTVIMPPQKPGTTPSASPHPLRVMLALAVPAPADLRARAVPLLQSGVGFDPAAGDSLEIVQLPPSSPYQVGTPIASAVGLPTRESMWDRSKPPALGIGWILAVVIAAIAAALLFSPLGRPLLRRQDSSAFTRRLRQLLDREEEARRG
jgi:flagellar M-ring protein FliF